MSAVNEILNQSFKIMTTLHLKQLVVVFDQALYAKAAEIKWKHSERYQNVILWMGIVHTICNLLSVIGKRFQDGGLKTIIIEAGVVAGGSVVGVMEGHRYNRGVRAHKYMYEALLHLTWDEFMSWIQEYHPDQVASIEAGLEIVRDLHDDLCQAVFEETMQNDQLQHVLQKFTNFLDFLRNKNGPLSAFWMSYINMVSVLLGLIQSSREGNW